MSIESFECLGCAFQRNKLILVQIDRLGFDLRTILYWLGYCFRKVSFVFLATIWANLDLRLMFCDLNLHLRYVKHLSTLMFLDGHIFQ